MTTTLAQGSSAVVTVAAGDYLYLNNTVTSQARAEITTGRGAGTILATNHTGRRQYGPFEAGTLTVKAVAGSLEYGTTLDIVQPVQYDPTSGALTAGGVSIGSAITGAPYIQTRPVVDAVKSYGVSPTNPAATNDTLLAQAVAYGQAHQRPLYIPGMSGGAGGTNQYPLSVALDLSAGSIQVFGDYGFSCLMQTTNAQDVAKLGGYATTLDGLVFMHSYANAVDSNTGNGFSWIADTQGYVLDNLYLYRNGYGIYSPSNKSVFSCNFRNIVTKYHSKGAISMAGGTGNSWSNIYANNDEYLVAGVKTPITDVAAINLYAMEFAGDQINIEGFVAGIQLYANNGSSVEINNLHIERPWMTGFGPTMIVAVGSKIDIQNVFYGYGDYGFTGASGVSSLVGTNYGGQIEIRSMYQPAPTGQMINTAGQTVYAATSGNSLGNFNAPNRISINNADLWGVTANTDTASTPYVVNVNETMYGFQSPAYAASLAIDFSLAVGNQDVVIGALTGAITLAAPTNVPARGKEVCIYLLQDGTGVRIPTWNAAYKGATLVGSGTANQKAIVKFRSDGTNLVQVFSSGWYT